jgi:ClpP class serine protease
MDMREQIWAAEKNELLRYLEAINSDYLNDKQISFFDDDDSVADNPGILSIDGKTASIAINGILTKDELPFIARLFGIKGTSFNTILKALSEVNANPLIDTVRLLMNTPGGEAIGTDEVNQAVTALAKGKHVIAENHGMIASGGYWIASAASEIVSLSPANMTGSIGVIITGFDLTERMNKMGVKKIVILSKNAPKKGGMHNAAGRAGLQEQVDAIERVFLQRISEGRGISVDVVAKTFGQGSILIAQDPDEKKHDALSVGMIDSVISGVTSSGNGGSPVVADDGGCGGGT